MCARSGAGLALARAGIVGRRRNHRPLATFSLVAGVELRPFFREFAVKIFDFISDKTVILHDMMGSIMGALKAKPIRASLNAAPVFLPAAGGFGGSNGCSAQIVMGPRGVRPRTEM